MEDKYTLNDSVFKYGLEKGSYSECFFDDNRKLMVVGGVACQLNMRDKPNLLRATTDIDFISDNFTTKIQRKKWAKELEDRITSEGYSVTGSLTRGGSQIKFEDYHPDFMLHLDCFGQNFFERHQKRIKSEYERAEIINLNGTSVKYQSPMDVIVNKIRRIRALEQAKLIHLDSNQNFILDLIYDAKFDYIDTTCMEDSLKKVSRVRNQTIEDLGRFEYSEIIGEVENYKRIKDFYDILGVIDSCREKNKKIYSQEFKRALKLALIE